MVVEGCVNGTKLLPWNFPEGTLEGHKNLSHDSQSAAKFSIEGLLNLTRSANHLAVMFSEP